MKHDISIIISSCDEYHKLWEGWYQTANYYGFLDLDWHVYFATEELDLPFLDDRITSIKTGILGKRYIGSETNPERPNYGGKKQIDEGWSNRVLSVLDKVDTSYVFFMQEDAWVKRQVNKKMFHSAFNIAKANNFDCIRITRILPWFPRDEYEITNFYCDNQRLLKLNNKNAFLMSHQNSIWNTEFLKSIMVPNEGVRDNEFEGTERIKELYPDHKIFMLYSDFGYDFPSVAENKGQNINAQTQDDLNWINHNIDVFDHYKLKKENYEYDKDKLKLSLVTSCYNGGRYLNELYESIIEQTYENFEWILADDFSNDDTSKIIHALQEKDLRIKVVYPEHKKQIWWNPQIHATGDIVCHLDADDKLLPNALELLAYYFNTFPDVVLMHFNASKYKEQFPTKDNILENYIDNVYVTNDNDSFLEGYSKLWPNRSNMFGYLRVFRNLNNLHFPEHDDTLGECVPNDGQWLITMEEKGKWLYIPRTVYLARNHGDSENHRNWNIRGDTKLIEQAKERRKYLRLDYPRNVKYFDSIHNIVESTFTSKLNFETSQKKISFINFDIETDTEQKIETLFNDHIVCLNQIDSSINYYYVNIFTYDKPDKIKKFLIQIKECNSNCEVIFFSRNAYQHINNRTNENNLHNIIEQLKTISPLTWFEQDNRFFIYLTFTSDIDMDFLNIIQVNPGYGVTIPPKSYGGIEQVVSHYISAFENRGHNVQTKWLGNITQNDIEHNDIIHCHTVNFYKQLKEKNIPYIFTIHDVHPFKPGYENLKEELKEVIQNSLITTCPSKKLVDLLDMPDKLIHVNHGVDTNFFYRNEDIKRDGTLLCVGSPEERKGFTYAIEAAIKLDLPIIIAGPLSQTQPEYNKRLEEYKEKYSKLQILGDVDKLKLRELLNQASITIHPADLETGQPCLSVLESLACGTPVIGTIQDDIEVGGMYNCERNVDSIIDGIIDVVDNYSNYTKEAVDFARSRNLENIYKNLFEVYSIAKKRKESFNNSFIDKAKLAYENSKISSSPNHFKIDYEPNPKITIMGPDHDINYKISFMDRNNGIVHYANEELKTNQWAATSLSYYIPWRFEAHHHDNLVWSEDLDLTGKKVHIIFDSTSLGDNVAWMAPVESFRLQHKCLMSVATFHNTLFEKVYPNIKFVEPNKGYEHECYITYSLGFYESGPRSPYDRKEVSLQQLGAAILGYNNYPETITKIYVDDKYELDIKKPYVAFGMQSTLQAKYWNYPNGWNDVIAYLKSKGYDVICVDKHNSFGKGDYMNQAPQGIHTLHERPIEEVVSAINGAEFYIGLGSGLSWVSWALHKPTILISGFSNPKSEFKNNCYRIFNEDNCNSCYNRYELDKGKWDWCPDHQDTDRMFECTKNITPDQVFTAIDHLENNNKINIER